MHLASASTRSASSSEAASPSVSKFLYVLLALLSLVLALILLRLFLHRLSHRAAPRLSSPPTTTTSSSSPAVPPSRPVASPLRAALDLAAPPTALLKPAADDVCAVCLDALCPGAAVRQLPCAHVFHDACALSWLVKANACPVCRRPPLEHPLHAYAVDLADDRDRASDPHSGLRALADRLADLDQQIEQRRRRTQTTSHHQLRIHPRPLRCTSWVGISS